MERETVCAFQNFLKDLKVHFKSQHKVMDLGMLHKLIHTPEETMTL